MSIIGTWLELPVELLFLLLTAFYLMTATLIHLLSFYGVAGRWFGSFKGIVGPFFTSVTVNFALLAAFIASDIWRRDMEASQVVRAEADTLLGLYYTHAGYRPRRRRASQPYPRLCRAGDPAGMAADVKRRRHARSRGGP